MTSNILVSIWNIVNFKERNISNYDSSYGIRINRVGEPFEYYIKDSFAGSFTLDLPEKQSRHLGTFSYPGAQNNPPDFIVRNGDAFEIKKREGKSGAIPLNSSPPKDVLRADDPRILSECRDCENEPWKEKEFYYIVGRVKNNIVEHVFYVHGKCYAASHGVYEKVVHEIKDTLETKTKGRRTAELGKIKEIGPLKNVDLRIRGMWNIDHPVKVFEKIYKFPDAPFSLAAILLEKKYLSYPENDRKRIENSSVKVNKVQINDPNSLDGMLKAILITYP